MKEVWQLQESASNIRSDADLSCIDGSELNDEQIRLIKNTIIRNTSELSFDIVNLIDKMQSEINMLKTLVNVCETRLDYAEDEIKKFKYERRRLNIG